MIKRDLKCTLRNDDLILKISPHPYQPKEFVPCINKGRFNHKEQKIQYNNDLNTSIHLYSLT